MTLDEARSGVNSLLLQSGTGPSKRDQNVATYLAGGKRFRAELLLLVAMGETDEIGGQAVRYAAFVEMVHAGGLCHDDVVDRSEFRRGRPSIASAAGTREAVLVGLSLMAHAYTFVAEDEAPVRAAVSRAATRVARGQADEMAGLFDTTLSPDRYLDRCRDKTGALYELSAELGGRAGRLGDGIQDAVVRFARRIGLAFQLADDVRDFMGDSVLGRPRGTDLREGVYTLPVLMMLREGRPGSAELGQILGALRNAGSQGDVDRLIGTACRILCAGGTMERARNRAELEVSAAFGEIDDAPESLRIRLVEFARGLLFGMGDTRAVA
jgi:heptaprenyl diphosphate synthase